ncbi:uncharacterized protein LOC100905534 [Galendromus occidentalis]|uniref:Uncharacterized protein LOC100905534 n=1 Tax=Galendromus occidentalis TaxID=34638 RepID=A0AAJ6QTQ2_9ACAR|nr:uncharacterized protein LOC100905534 [Galendromus occidentalis]
MASRSLVFSLLSGFLASLSSVLGKLGMASDRAAAMCQTVLSAWFETTQIEAFYLCESILSLVRGGFLLSMIACNALMWTIFTKALRSSSSTVEVTVVNLAANFFCSAIFGQSFFGERLTLVWALGSVIIIIGLALIHVGSKRNVESGKLSQEKHCDMRYPGAEKIYERHLARKSQ